MVYDVGLRMEILFFRLFILGLFSFWRGGEERRGEEKEVIRW